MKKQLRSEDTIIISDIDRLGRNADDIIVEIKVLQSKEIRVVALDVPFLNDWQKMNDDSLFKMIIGIFVTLKAHIVQQEKEKIHDRVMQGLNVAKAKDKKLGRPTTGVPKKFVKEYNKFQSGEYGRISEVQFSKLQGIAVSTFYKYVTLFLVIGAVYKKGRDDQEYESSCETTRVLRKSGHSDEEIIQILQKRMGLDKK